jgi:transcriptional regulator with XRE-family HTH domain
VATQPGKRPITGRYACLDDDWPVNDRTLGGIVRSLRHRRRWRQEDLARRAGVSRSLMSLLERGHAERLSVRSVRRIAATLDVRLDWDAGFRGAELARLRDADHARLSEWLARRLGSLGWTVTAEISFNRYGDRGRIDLLAHEPISRVLLVIEVKTVIADVQDLLGALHVKQRVGAGEARLMGWDPAVVVPMLAVREGSTNRRRVAAHERLFSRLALRGHAAAGWLRRPGAKQTGLLLYVKLPDGNAIDGRRAGRQRVRPLRARPSASPQPERAKSASEGV